MTSSDKKMDRTLSSLPVFTPDYSAWPAIEAHLNETERRRRQKQLVGYGFSGIAASLIVALGVLGQLQSKPQAPGADLQSTVDAAIRDARPKAMFTGLNLTEPRPELTALLVSAKPRGEFKAVYLGDLFDNKRAAEHSDADEEQKALAKENQINEF